MTNNFTESRARTSISVVVIICISLAALIWIVFGQTIYFDFVNYDDQTYVYQEPHIANGITLSGLAWAFTHFHSGNWHPLTTISHILDCQFYGLNAGGHHLTNVLLHTVAAILLFIALWQLTAGLWRSAFVAALFAVHPLHVESVAWVSERKDVLSAVLFMSILWTYNFYVRRQTALSYFSILLLLVLGLMAKPMMVTVPFVLLLLDYWPLKRTVDLVTFRNAVTEKLPLIALALLSGVVTLFAQKETVSSLDKLPVLTRLANAITSYLAYLWQMIYPFKLAPFYTYHADQLALGRVSTALLVLVALTWLMWTYRQRAPYLVTGWFWYLGMLVPVIGLVQVSIQARADRYTYLPQIGLYIVLTWGVAHLLARYQRRAYVLAPVAIAALVTLMVVAHQQVSYWRNGETLWTRALQLNANDGLAEFSLGEFLLSRNRLDEATPHLQRAVDLLPSFAPAHFQLAIAASLSGKIDSAIAHYRTMLALGSESAAVHYNLANLLHQQGNLEAATTEYEQALRLRPGDTNAETNLANALLEQGKIEEAIAHYRNIVKLQPHDATSHYNLAAALHREGRLQEAIAEYRNTLSLDSSYKDAHSNLGNALIAAGRVEEGERELSLSK